MKDNQLLTISQLSKLRHISIDTLRYYDKIDLFKPTCVNDKTGYRYYSITQYEVLGTIIELRDIGLSVENIKAYMDDRNAKKSISLLKEHSLKLEEEIASLKKKHDILNERILNIEQFHTQYRENHVVIKSFDKRLYFQSEKPINMGNEVELSYSILSLEQQVNEKIPLIANQRIGHMTTFCHGGKLNRDDVLPTDLATVFLLADEASDETCQEIPQGTYVCTTYAGLNRYASLNALNSLLSFCKINRLETIDNRSWNIIQIDTSITNLADEAIYEIQVQIQD
ncbi:MerR family transcriptional regulator [Vibrio sp. Y2-5]|uniref:MerR family transcriptional regulator n=1 Tax=Vibrio sp. Y2-5 TaxID=2743977 RepID=UPI0016606FD6|nr:MerR family transcriptional regulator [Vibrio sp. Y2-5]MBD0788352.1 MerR family transcriptional regulator [Vibrio sp. Y2-5]